MGGVLGHVYPVMLLHIALLPLNLWRLNQLLQLTRLIENASAASPSLDWLKPFFRRKSAKVGDVLFRLGDPAVELLFILSGQFRAIEADAVLQPGDVIGELGLITRGKSEHRRLCARKTDCCFCSHTMKFGRCTTRILRKR